MAEIEQRMSSAMVSRVLLVETWSGRNRRLLQDSLSRRQTSKFPVALCYRQETSCELRELILAGKLAAVRMATADMQRDWDFCRDISRSHAWLLAHAEDGIGPLSSEVTRLYESFPEVRFYVPHLAWPMRDGALDPAWEWAVKQLAQIPSVLAGISAIAHFSKQPFPHSDVRELALRFLSQFPASRIAIGSDYPLFEKERYADYIRLAHSWVTAVHPRWTDHVTFEGSN
ncbi:MAG TPA: amidohydrolase family protein [Bryobacteraceae bacterium]|nr:amidohydrolase family protein [Bryobacteraceae bacterium]